MIQYLTVEVSKVFTTPAVVRLLMTKDVPLTIEADGAESPLARVPDGVL